jgi:ribosomal protein S18 acetylase RimI-like enzyme
MAVLVRAAAEADLDALVELNGSVQGLHVRLYPSDFKETSVADKVRAFFATRLGEIAVAESDGATVGYVWCEAQRLPETPFTPAKPRLYIHHLSVASPARRRGVGAALVRYAQQLAGTQGLPEIALGVWAANRDALRFFKTQGFVLTTATLRKRSDTPRVSPAKNDRSPRRSDPKA